MVAHSGVMTMMDRAARKAGAKLRRDFYEVQQLQVSRKGPADFVSKADMRSERTIYDELSKAKPDWGFLMEEAGSIEGDPSKPRFIVDPLDGTSNFLHGIPHFAISIAVEEELANGSPASGGDAAVPRRRVRLVWWATALVAALFVPSPFGYMSATSIFLWGLVGDPNSPLEAAQGVVGGAGLLTAYTLIGYALLRGIVERLLYRR